MTQSTPISTPTESRARRSSALESPLAPLAEFLDDPHGVEIMVNADGSVWVEWIGGKPKETAARMAPADSDRFLRLCAAEGLVELNAQQPSLAAKAWNDKKVTAHHAIIPTPSADAAAAQLPLTERAVYELIARRYLAQFYPHHDYLQTKLELDVAGETFVAKGRQILAPGWRALSAEVRDDDAGDEPKESAAPLPRLAQGDAVVAVDAAVLDKKTQPPKAFTDASLIAAMCAVAKFVTNPNVKKILTETDGVGTPATRASIIETLFDRGYVTRVKETIVSTETGRALIGALPAVATTPDMTAMWEAAMRAILDGSQSLDAFLSRVGAQLADLVAKGRALGHITVPAHSPRATAQPASSKRTRAREASHAAK